MTALRRWGKRREREAIVRHLARCSFCRALLAYSRRRSDRALLDAAEHLACEHVTNDAERQAFTRHGNPPQGRVLGRRDDAAACETGS